MKRRQLAKVEHKNGKPTIVFNSKVSFLSDLSDFKEGSRIWVQLESYSPLRSLKQNSLLHIWITILADELGYEMDEMKRLLKEKFAKYPILNKHGEEMCDENGEVMISVKDTSDMNKEQMSSFMDKIYRWAIDFNGTVLPQPQDQLSIPLDPDAEHNKSAITNNNKF